MAITTKIEAIETLVDVVIRDDLSPKGRQQAMADYSRARLADALGANQRALGKAPKYDTFVDGRPEARLESVNPDGGRIVFEFELVEDFLRWIMQTLRDRSPVRSGAYREGHTLFADGRAISIDGQIPVAEEYDFVNTVPYARKIEVGKTKSGRDFVIQAPNRIYERTAADAKRRFGNLAQIKLSYLSPIHSYAPAGSVHAARSRKGGEERSTRNPAIIVTLR